MTLDEVFPNSNKKHYGETFEVLEVGSPKRTTSKFKLLCTVCNCIVEMKPVKVFGGQKACKCSTMYYKNSERRLERLLDKLAGKNITPLHIPENLKWHHYVSLECNSCNYRWSTQENSLVNYDAGCPDCAGVRKLTEDEVKSRLYSLVGNSKIASYRIIDYQWSSGEIEVQCTCGYTRITTPRSAYYDSESCMGCAVTGFKNLDPATLYLLELKSNVGVVVGYKYGIAGNMEQRHQKISRHFKGSISVWCSWDYPVGYLAQKHENTFKKAFPNLMSKEELKDGWTETFSPELLSCFLTLQQLQYEKEFSNGF